MLFPGPDLHCAGRLALRRFPQHLSANIGEDRKKSHHLSSGPLAGTVTYYVKSGSGYCITFIKRLDEGPR